MSAPMIMAAVKLIAVAKGTMTAIQGIREGNLMKAVVGGATAYFGASGLIGPAGPTAAAGTTLANPELGMAARAAGRTATENSALSGLSTATNASGNLANPELGLMSRDLARNQTQTFGDLATATQGGGAAGAELSVAGDSLATAQDGAQTVMSKAGNGPSWLADMKTGWNGLDSYTKGQSVSGLMQLGGGYMAGDAAQEKAEWELAQKERLYQEQRARRATTAASPYKGTQWNYQTGRFEATA